MKKFGFPPYYQTEGAVSDLESTIINEEFLIEGERFGLVHRGKKDAPVIVFVHGSPGQWDAWAEYLNDADLNANSYMIAVDRLGFGTSDNGDHEPNLARHAKFIMEGVQGVIHDDQKVIVVGHSYGGPVALRMAVDYPERIAALTLLAPSIDPDLETPRWYNHVAAMPIISHILPASVRHSNEEILPLRAELQAMREKLDIVTAPAAVVQGMADTLVPYQNAEFAKKELINSNIEVTLIDDRGHFIPWQEFDLVKETLLAFIQSR